jgi:hypothetical protein
VGRRCWNAGGGWGGRETRTVEVDAEGEVVTDRGVKWLYIVRKQHVSGSGAKEARLTRRDGGTGLWRGWEGTEGGEDSMGRSRGRGGGDG